MSTTTSDMSSTTSDMSSITENMSESEIQRLNEEKLYKFMGIEPYVLDGNSPVTTQPKDIKIQLKQHQLALIKECRNLEQSSMNPIIYKNYSFKTKIGIIGDIVGSGKTLSILGLISEKKNIKTFIQLTHGGSSLSYHLLNENIDTDDFDDMYKNTDLIVIPHNIYKQWINVIENQTNLSYMSILIRSLKRNLKKNTKKKVLIVI